ncbi:NrdI family protein [Paucilactobacillus oligofermentans DSM 15707 = LMG 22743]|uniref:NrdI family protein n=1 Tax=Paucilactobacillus oligofermentans DSM 15707 = LMG 22743 TaxID=1423778 RepID=A0A0R1RCQ0_9LACO|nr:class Ib ribonucleoside-diphosphate reductase assembly flavoprotein NrdI [Paucilactobacillus oligofermentans]KRL54615.1 NrdI family protein [Paucilactobacillus oligofermentans DSM 15707 = LMG 22743]CUS26476.1 Flavoprotein NrdI [Paucilactobacillus oligofermentans DSM 15707 = LMG 22743]
MEAIYILYISIEGNTQSFLDRLCRYSDQQNAINPDMPLVKLHEITEQTDFKDEQDEFFVFVPTYLDGGNGIDSGVKELMTNPLGEYIAFHNNARLCCGIIGSGNLNFNEQYCLTARRYSKNFNAPVIDDYELRGTSSDIERIYNNMANIIK